MRRLATLIALLVTLAAVPATAQAAVPQRGGDNTAIAVNTRDDSSVFRLAFSIRRVMNGVVDHVNAAVAYASCERCTATAIAIQAVLAGTQPETVTPTNLAIAINEECSSCTSMAFAYQFVLGTDGPAHFTSEGNRALSDIRRRLHALRHESPSATELDARLSALMDELRTVLDEELVSPATDPQRSEPPPEPGGRPETPHGEPPLEDTKPTPSETEAPPEATENPPDETEPAPDDAESELEGDTTPPQEEPTGTAP